MKEAVLQTAERLEDELQINAYEISDSPDVSWRGLMVDLARGNYSSDGPIVEENTAALAQRLWNEERTVGYEAFAKQKARVSELLNRMIEDRLAENL